MFSFRVSISSTSTLEGSRDGFAFHELHFRNESRVTHTSEEPKGISGVRMRD